jgi:hypothetical protein
LIAAAAARRQSGIGHKRFKSATSARIISECEFVLGGLAAIGSDKKRLVSPEPGKKPSGVPKAVKK